MLPACMSHQGGCLVECLVQVFLIPVYLVFPHFGHLLKLANNQLSQNLTHFKGHLHKFKFINNIYAKGQFINRQGLVKTLYILSKLFSYYKVPPEKHGLLDKS